MMPWNPIHRYAGLNSSFDPLGDEPWRRADVGRGHAEGGEGDAVWAPGHRPLGFVDVRDDASGADGAQDAGSGPAEPEGMELGSATAESADPAVEASEPEPFVPWVQAEEKVPFYKREITLGRKRKPEPVAAPESGEEKVPFYKRELSFRRREEVRVAEPDTLEESVAAEAESVATEPEPAAVEPEPAATEPEPAAVEPEPVAAAAVPAQPDPIEWPEEEVEAAEVESPVAAAAAEPVSEPASAPAPDPVPVQAPTPATAPVAKAPLHKRQISLGRPRGAKAAPGGGRNGSQHRHGGKVVGLKIGASQLAAAVVHDHDGRHELVELARTPLDHGIVVDGEIRDADALVSALRAFFAEHKLPTRDVRIGLASNRIGVRTFEIAGVEDDSRFDNAVRFKAHEVLPIAVSESVLDYRVLEERRSETGETTRRILLVVAPRDQVAPYAEVAQRAGLKLAGIDLEALGLLRTFVEPQAPGTRRATDTATVVVAIGHEASTLLVSGGGVCEFTRVFDWGGSTLQDAIAQELQVLPAEAGTILRHLSLAGSSARIEGIDEEARNRAVEAVRLRFTPFARELVSSLQFYQTQPGSLGIGEIVITGGTSQLDGLAEALHQMIGVAVRVGDPLQRLAVQRGAEAGFEPVLGSLSVAIGLGIDDEAVRGVDLTPRDLAKDAKRLPRLLPILAPAAAAVPIAALALLFVQAHGSVSDRQSRLNDLQTELARLPQPKLPQIDASLQGAQAQRASAVAQVLGSRPTWDAMLRDFSRVLPDNVWLTALSAKTARPLSAPTAATASQTTAATPNLPAAPTGVTITGNTFTQADVADLLARLSALPSLQNVQLQSSSTAAVGDKTVTQFSILADMREAGGGA